MSGENTQAQKPGTAELVELARGVKLLVLDVDGVLTDGGLYYGPSGELLKRFDVKDSHGLVMARLVGLPAAVLTARKSSIVEVRAREVGVVAVVQGKRDKRQGLLELLSQVKVDASACAYMGDDVNDLAPMSMVRLPACPADAVPDVRKNAAFVAQSRGGGGAVRELVELCLRAQDLYERALSFMVQGFPYPRD